MAGIEFAELPLVAIGASIVMTIVLGTVWYAPQVPTGRIWMREVGMSPDVKPDPKKMGQAMGIMLLSAVLMMFVLAHVMVAFRDAFRLDGVPTLGLTGAITAGVLVWLGFQVPLVLNGVAFENKSWTLFGINAGYYLVSMVLAGVIFAQFL
jgi:hypothetical protein